MTDLVQSAAESLRSKVVAFEEAKRRLDAAEQAAREAKEEVKRVGAEHDAAWGALQQVQDRLLYVASHRDEPPDGWTSFSGGGPVPGMVRP